MTLGILAEDLALVLLYLITRAADLRDVDNIGVFCPVVALSAYNELTLSVVDINLCVVSEHTCSVKVVEVLSVLLTIGELSLYVLKGGFFASRKKRRQLARTLAANISVLEFSVA